VSSRPEARDRIVLFGDKTRGGNGSTTACDKATITYIGPDRSVQRCISGRNSSETGLNFWIGLFGRSGNAAQHGRILLFQVDSLGLI
jgi:hypothetical protein